MAVLCRVPAAAIGQTQNYELDLADGNRTHRVEAGTQITVTLRHKLPNARGDLHVPQDRPRPAAGAVEAGNGAGAPERM